MSKSKQSFPEHTRESRLELVTNIKNKLRVLEIYSLKFPAIAQLDSILNEYIETGHHFQGKIKFPESHNRKIVYLLSNKLHVQSYVNLKYIGN